MAQRLEAMVVGLVCRMVVAGITHAQKRDEPAALDAELDRLYQAGQVRRGDRNRQTAARQP